MTICQSNALPLLVGWHELRLKKIKQSTKKKKLLNTKNVSYKNKEGLEDKVWEASQKTEHEEIKVEVQSRRSIIQIQQ